LSAQIVIDDLQVPSFGVEDRVVAAVGTTGDAEALPGPSSAMGATTVRTAIAMPMWRNFEV
jgi:hypothetical protein